MFIPHTKLPSNHLRKQDFQLYQLGRFWYFILKLKRNNFVQLLSKQTYHHRGLFVDKSAITEDKLIELR